MTQNKEAANKIAELNALFLTLNEKAQDSALNILRSLEFAQSVMYEQSYKKSQKSPKKHT